MKTTVSKWGNSSAIRIPKAFGFKVGQKVQLTLKNNNIVISKPRITLKELLKKVNPKNVHHETDFFGKPVGKEIW